MWPFSADHSLPANAANLRRLLWLRNIALVGQTAALAIAAGMAHLHALGIEHLELEVLSTPIVIGMLRSQPPMAAAGFVIACLAVANIVICLRLRGRPDVTQLELLSHLLVDVTALTALLYLTGGATNPFALLLVLPVIIAATVLPARFAWIVAALTVMAYSLLLFKFVPLPHSHAPGHDFALHVLSSWLGYVLIAALVAYFVVGMSNTLRRQERLLAQAREQTMRDEQLLALGTLAASTAHELGTPLGTLSLLVSELDQEDAAENVIRRNVPALRAQVERCKVALSVLSASAGGVQLAGGRLMQVDDYLVQLLSDWQGRRPGTTVRTVWRGAEPAPMILAERTLSQALTSILDNAADVSPEDVEWHAKWSQDELSMEVRDRGPGLGEQAQRHAGRLPFSDKPHGLGLGLFLSHGIIDRLGGRVILRDRQQGGLATLIHLPLNTLTRIAPA